MIDTAEKLKNDPDIDVIATASLGGGSPYFLDNGEAASDSDKVTAIDSMWQEWRDAGKEVITIGEVPQFGDTEAPTCVDSNPESISTDCSVSYDEGIKSRGTFQRITAEEGSADINFYDPADGVCKDGTCYSMVGHLITRYDKHHLSEEFAKSYAPDFTRFMYEDVLD